MNPLNREQTSTKFPKISIFLPGWNERENILKCIEQLKNQTYPNFNIYLILGGNDPFIEKAKAIPWNALIILDQIEPSKNKALNQALDHPEIGEILIFSDIDCIFPDDYLEKYYQVFQDESKNVIAGRVQAYKQKLDLLEQYINLNETRRAKNAPDKGTFLVGANFAIRTSFFKTKIGSFDESIKSSTDARFVAMMKEMNEPIYLDKSSIISSDFKTNSLHAFIKQQSRWFRNILLYSKDFENKRNLLVALIYSSISIAIFILLPLFMIISAIFIKIPAIFIGTLILEIILVGFLWIKRFKDLNQPLNDPSTQASRDLLHALKNIWDSLLIAILYSFIALIGTFRFIFAHDKTKSWKK